MRRLLAVRLVRTPPLRNPSSESAGCVAGGGGHGGDGWGDGAADGGVEGVMGKSMVRILFCAVPGLIAGALLWLMGTPLVAIAVCCGLFGLGWDATTPRPERGEHR